VSDTLPTVWPIEDHTLAKHAILKRYLQAWFPILSHQSAIVRSPSQQILYIDGFAGPGEYEKGEIGSPILALQAALEHSRNFPRPVRLIFVEAREDRYNHLLSVLSRYERDLRESRNVIIDPPRLGECDAVLSELLSTNEKRGIKFGPAIAFLDQFGYSAVSMDLVRRIMRFPQCEVFSYLDYKDMNRWITDDSKAPAYSRTYGGEEWRKAVEMPERRRRAFLFDLYKEMLLKRADVRYVYAFSMFDYKGILLYWLFFCTNSIRGLEEMKKAMWTVDKTGSFRFSDKDNPDQANLLNMDYGQDWLADRLIREFEGRETTVGSVKAYVLEQTPCYLFREALGRLYRDGQLQVPQPPPKWKKGSFASDEMILSFPQKRLF
jgi:three-Cys-motif partner protein